MQNKLYLFVSFILCVLVASGMYVSAGTVGSSPMRSGAQALGAQQERDAQLTRARQYDAPELLACVVS